MIQFSCRLFTQKKKTRKKLLKAVKYSGNFYYLHVSVYYSCVFCIKKYKKQWKKILKKHGCSSVRTPRITKHLTVFNHCKFTQEGTYHPLLGAVITLQPTLHWGMFSEVQSCRLTLCLEEKKKKTQPNSNINANEQSLMGNRFHHRNYVLLRLQIWVTKLSESTYFVQVAHHILINKLALLEQKRKKIKMCYTLNGIKMVDSKANWQVIIN